MRNLKSRKQSKDPIEIKLPAPDMSFMDMALSLALRGLGQTGVNPSVGCVIVKEGQIVARGRTGSGGRPHAELRALEWAGQNSEAADLYTTLEPCAHQGQTPPCVGAIIKARIARVIYALEDPDPRVSGRGIETLKKAGIETVFADIDEKKRKKPIEGYLLRQTRQMPLFSLKIATSLDGKIALANRKSQWITGEQARRHAHLIRAHHDAVLTGVNTVIEDNPLLTCRIPGLEAKTPIRIILDSSLRLPVGSQVLEKVPEMPVWVITGSGGDETSRKNIEVSGASVLTTKEKDGRIDLHAMAHLLAKKGLNNVLVEAGAGVITEFLKQPDMITRIYHYQAGCLIGGDGLDMTGALAIEEMQNLARWQAVSSQKMADDRLTIFERKNPCSPG